MSEDTCIYCNGTSYYRPPKPPNIDQYLYRPMPKDRAMLTGARVKELEQEIDSLHGIISWLVECCECWPCDNCNGTGIIKKEPTPVEARQLEL